MDDDTGRLIGAGKWGGLKMRWALVFAVVVGLDGFLIPWSKPACADTVTDAWRLYTSKKFEASAVTFERALASAPPSPRLYYYAALANREAKRTARARQLFEYVAKNFPSAPEAALSAVALGGTSAAAAVSALPGGNAASPAAVAGSGSSVRSGESGRRGSNSAVARELFARPHKKGDFPFSAEDIARDGAHGVDQTNAPNCWFESTVSALAQLPRGQRLLARMITYGDGESFIVRFPGDGVEYKISTTDMRNSGVSCKALWASLIDYAQRQKFPDNAGAAGAYSDQHRLQTALSCITGSRAELIKPGQASTQEVSSFIYGAVSSQNPVTAGTAGRDTSIAAPIIEGHAYTVIGFEPARGMVTVRNPHGRSSQRFSLPDDPQHLKFEQLDDGVFKMHVDLFRVSFGSLCRANI